MREVDFKTWSWEEDVRWCANLALVCGALIILAGVIFANYAEAPMVKCYTMTASLIFGALFGAVGVASHLYVRHQIRRTTIIHLDRKGKHK